MLGLIEKFFSIRVFGIAKVLDGAYRRPSVYTIFFSLFRQCINFPSGQTNILHVHVSLA